MAADPDGCSRARWLLTPATACYCLQGYQLLNKSVPLGRDPCYCLLLPAGLPAAEPEWAAGA